MTKLLLLLLTLLLLLQQQPLPEHLLTHQHM
jgi:hypothetical protein